MRWCFLVLGMDGVRDGVLPVTTRRRRQVLSDGFTMVKGELATFSIRLSFLRTSTWTSRRYSGTTSLIYDEGLGDDDDLLRVHAETSKMEEVHCETHSSLIMPELSTDDDDEVWLTFSNDQARTAHR